MSFQLRAGKSFYHLPRHLQNIWDGAPLHDKRVLVHCFHGLGDTIQFIRYAPMLQAIAREVIVWAQQPLIPLLQTMKGIDRLLPLHDGSPDADFDAGVEVMELPHVFRTTSDTIPAAIPYFKVPPLWLSFRREKIAAGVVWKAGDWDSRRSIPFSLLESLADIPGIDLYILQDDAEAAGWTKGVGIYPGSLELWDYARFISGLDLIISVDSMPAHLAGALGVPVWTLLHAAADWRWMKQGADSPWYPTMRLFRQERPGDWALSSRQYVKTWNNSASLRKSMRVDELVCLGAGDDLFSGTIYGNIDANTA